MESIQIDGAELAYEDHGDGPPVLLVHGTGAYTDVWGDIPQRLAEVHRVITYDRRGFGASSGKPAENLGRQADDAAELLAGLEAGPATVVGWSGGGVIASILAIRHADRVASLVLSEPALHLSTHMTLAGLRMTVRHQIARRIRRDPGAAAAHMYRWVTPAGTKAMTFDDYPDQWRAQMIENGPAAVREMDQQLLPQPRRRELAAISCPITVMVGDCSEPVFPRCARVLMRARPETRWVDVPGAGHAPHLDLPELWVQTVAESAASVAGGAREPAAS